MKFLVIGDFHIPDRARQIPSEIWNFIQNLKFDMVLCTGDLTSPKLYDKLQSIAPTKNVVGNMDYYLGSRNFPTSVRIPLTYCNIGLTHGTGVRPRGDPDQLAIIALKLQVDILISGHTHAQSVKLHKNILLLNPGSATGSWGGGPSTGIPSFQILEVKEGKLHITSIALKSGRLIHQHHIYDPKTKNLQ
ncbi:MAG: YfcE family phosphodiesterase [Candidatus Helarchaeota archaeon]